MAGTLGLDEFELLIVLPREPLLKELKVLGKDLSVSGLGDTVDAHVDRL